MLIITTLSSEFVSSLSVVTMSSLCEIVDLLNDFCNINKIFTTL